MRNTNKVVMLPKGFPGGSVGKESAYKAGDLGSIPGLGRSPGEENGYLLQYSGLENSMDCIAHGAAKSWTPLSDFLTHTCSLSIIKFKTYCTMSFSRV